MSPSLSRTWLLVLLALVATPANAQTPFTLQDAFQRAIHNHPTIQQAVARMDGARAQMDVARNAWLPTANLDANWQLATFNRTSTGVTAGLPSPTPSYAPNTLLNASVSGRWTAWDFGRTSANVGAADQTVAATLEDIRAAKAALWQGIASAWVSVMAADASLQVLRAGRDQLQRSRDNVAQQVKLRARAEVDLFKVEADLAAAEGDVLRAEEAARGQRTALAVAIGEPRVPTETLASPEFPLPPDVVPQANDATVDLLTLRAVENRPEFAALRARLAASRSTLLALERVLRPSVYVGAQGSAGGPALDNLAINYALTLGISFPLASLWTQKPVITDTAAQIRNLQATQDAQVLQLRGQLNLALMQWLQAGKRVPVAEHQAKYAEAAHKAASARYQAGAGLWLEVADAETGITKARLAVVQAQLDVATAQAQLLYLVGLVN